MSNRFLRIAFPTAIDAWPHARRRILPAPPGLLAPSLHSLTDSRAQTFRGFSQLTVALYQAHDSTPEKELEDEYGEFLNPEKPIRRVRTVDDYKRAGPPPSEQDDEDIEDLNLPPSKIIRVRKLPKYVGDAVLDNFLAPYVGVVRYHRSRDLAMVEFIDVEHAQTAMEALKRDQPTIKRIDGPAKWGDHVPKYSYEPAPPPPEAPLQVYEMELHGIGTADTNQVARHLWGLGIVAGKITLNPDKPGTCSIDMKRASELAHAIRHIDKSKMVQDDDTETTISVTTSVDLTAFEPKRPTGYAPRARSPSMSSNASDATYSWRSDGSRGAPRGGFRGAPRGRVVRGRGRGRGDYQRYSQNGHEASQGDQESSTAESTYDRGRGRGRGDYQRYSQNSHEASQGDQGYSTVESTYHRGRGRARGSIVGNARGRGRGASHAPRDSWNQGTEDAPSEGGEGYRGRGRRGQSRPFGAAGGRSSSYAPRGGGASTFRGGPSRGRDRGRGREDARETPRKSGWKAELYRHQEGE